MSQWPSDARVRDPGRAGDPTSSPSPSTAREVQAPRGELLIKVAQEHGIYIPRFCWHERMKPVGMCRMCLVEVEGMRGLPICVRDARRRRHGRAHAVTDDVKKAQDGVLEFLLINHPLDCPVCDRGGECPLQDQTLAFGPGESRFVEEKRHFEKPIPISDLVLLDRERCIQCGRCTRFADEIAGDPLIDFGERGGEHAGHHLPRRAVHLVLLGQHRADLPGRRAHRDAVPVPGPAVGPRRRSRRRARTCAVQCRGALRVDVEPARAPARRRLRAGEPRLAVRQGPLRLRVGALRRPRARPDGAQGRRARRGVVARGARRRGRRDLRGALDLHGPASVARARRRARHQRGRVRVGPLRQGRARHRQRRRAARRRPARRGRARPARARRSPTSTAPRRSSSLGARPQGGAAGALPARASAPPSSSACRSIELAPRDQGLTPYATAVAPPRCPASRRDAPRSSSAALGGGATADDDAARRGREPLDGRDGDVVVVLGRRSLAESADADRRRPPPRSPSCPGVAVPLGAAPRQRARRARPRPHARASCPAGSRSTPGAPGSTRRVGHGARRARASTPPGSSRPRPTGTIHALVLLGADPLRRLPRPRRSPSAALDARRLRRSRSTRSSPTARERADVFLPVTLWGEKTGTRHEPRGPRAAPRPQGRARRHRRWTTGASPPSSRCGSAPTSTSRPSTRCRTRSPGSRPRSPASTPTLLRRARDGVGAAARRAPRRARARARSSIPLTDARWEPIRPGIAADESRPSPRGDRRRADGPAPTPIEPGREPASAGGRRARPRGADPAAARRCTAGTATSPDADGRRRATRTLSASWPAARSTTAGRGRRRVAGRSRALVPRRRSLLVNPQRPRRASASSDGAEVRVTSPRGTVDAPGRAPTTPCPPGTALPRVRTGTGAGVGDLVDVDAAGHRPAGGDARGECRRSRPTRCFDGGVDLDGRPHRHRQDDRRLRAAAACSVLLYIWFMRKVIADMQNRIGPDRAGPFGVLQTLADGIKLFFKEQSIPTPPTGACSGSRPYLVDPARVPRVLRSSRSAARSRSPATRRTCSSPTCRSACCCCSRCRASALYGVMLAGWSSGSKYPLLGSVRASAQLLSLRGRVRPRDRRRAASRRARCRRAASSTQQAWDELGLVRHRLVLAPGDRRRSSSSSSPRSPRRTTRRSTSSRRSRSSSAGSTPSTPASASRSSSSPSS